MPAVTNLSTVFIYWREPLKNERISVAETMFDVDIPADATFGGILWGQPIEKIVPGFSVAEVMCDVNTPADISFN